MKKFLKWTAVMSVCAVLFSMVMVSCGDDDDEKNDNNNYSEMIIGTWSTSGDYDGSSSGGNYNYGYIFRMNGTYTEFGSGRSDGTYRISGNVLTLQNDYGVETKIILSLTDKKLIFDDDEIDTYYRVSDH